MRAPILPFVFLILLSAFTQAQNPGYMGKKRIVGYGMYFNPVTFGSTATNKSLFKSQAGSSKSGYLRFNFSQELFIEGAVGKNTSLGFSVRYMKTGYDNRSSVYSSVGRPSGYYTIKALSFVPYIKAYFGRYLAPWGRYFIVGPVITQMRSQHDEYMYMTTEVNGHDTLITNFGSDADRTYRGDLLLGFGRNRIIFDRVSLDYGFCFQAIATLLAVESVDSELLGGAPVMQEYISRTMNYRVRGASRFNMFFKIGYLF